MTTSMLRSQEVADREDNSEHFCWMMFAYIRFLGVTSRRIAEVVHPTSPRGLGHDPFLPVRALARTAIEGSRDSSTP